MRASSGGDALASLREAAARCAAFGWVADDAERAELVDEAARRFEEALAPGAGRGALCATLRVALGDASLTPDGALASALDADANARVLADARSRWRAAPLASAPHDVPSDGPPSALVEAIGDRLLTPVATAADAAGDPASEALACALVRAMARSCAPREAHLVLLELAHDRLDAIRGATDPDPLAATRADADPSDARRRGWRLAAVALEALATCLRRADHIRRDPSEAVADAATLAAAARALASEAESETEDDAEDAAGEAAEARKRADAAHVPAEAFEANLLGGAAVGPKDAAPLSGADLDAPFAWGSPSSLRLAAGALERAGLAALGEAASAPESAFARGPPNSRRSNPRHSNPSALHPGDAASAFALAALSRNCAEPRVAAAALAVFERCSIVRTDEADAGDASLSDADGAAADDPVAAPLAFARRVVETGWSETHRLLGRVDPRAVSSGAAVCAALRCRRAPNEPRVPTDEEHRDEDAPGAEEAFEGDGDRRSGDDGRATNRANAAERRANAAAERRANAAASAAVTALPPSRFGALVAAAEAATDPETDAPAPIARVALALRLARCAAVGAASADGGGGARLGAGGVAGFAPLPKTDETFGGGFAYATRRSGEAVDEEVPRGDAETDPSGAEPSSEPSSEPSFASFVALLARLESFASDAPVPALAESARVAHEALCSRLDPTRRFGLVAARLRAWIDAGRAESAEGEGAAGHRRRAIAGSAEGSDERAEPVAFAAPPPSSAFAATLLSRVRADAAAAFDRASPFLKTKKFVGGGGGDPFRSAAAFRLANRVAAEATTRGDWDVAVAGLSVARFFLMIRGRVGRGDDAGKEEEAADGEAAADGDAAADGEAAAAAAARVARGGGGARAGGCRRRGGVGGRRHGRAARPGGVRSDRGVRLGGVKGGGRRRRREGSTPIDIGDSSYGAGKERSRASSRRNIRLDDDDMMMLTSACVVS